VERLGGLPDDKKHIQEVEEEFVHAYLLLHPHVCILLAARIVIV
jgi:hypothetical protein